MKYPKVELIIDKLNSIKDYQFDMSNPHMSGNPPAGCIGAWASTMIEESSIVLALWKLCDIPIPDARNICFPDSPRITTRYSHISKENAIRFLNFYMEFGELDYDLLNNR